MTETITDVAIRLVTGTIYSTRLQTRRGAIHLYKEARQREPDSRSLLNFEPGFLTNTYRFVNQIEARLIARATRQIDETLHSQKLWPEDLWRAIS